MFKASVARMINNKMSLTNTKSTDRTKRGQNIERYTSRNSVGTTAIERLFNFALKIGLPDESVDGGDVELVD